LLNPAQKRTLVQQPDIQVAIILNTRAGEKSEQADSVVELNKDDAAVRLCHNLGAIPVGIRVFHIA
jgi:hypothetical protein